MDSRHFGQQFVTVQLGEAVIVVNPCHQLCKRDAQAVIQWPVGPHGHDCVLILKAWPADLLDRKSTRLNSSHVEISYAVFCLKKKKKKKKKRQNKKYNKINDQKHRRI